VWLRPLRDNHDAVFATRLALYELGKLVDDGLSAEGFEQTREFLHKYVALLVKSPARRLGYAIDSAWYGIGDFVDYVRSGLDGLTVEAVNAALRRHIDPARMKFVFVAQDAQDLQARLVNDTPSEMRYNTAKPAEVLEEDAVVGKLPLDFAKDAVQIAAADSLFA
jgi:zinc protease